MRFPAGNGVGQPVKMRAPISACGGRVSPPLPASVSNTDDTTQAGASPFKKKTGKKDSAGTALLVLGYLGIGLCLVASVMSFL